MKNLKYELLIDGKKEIAYVDPNNQEKFLEKHSNNFPIEVLNIEGIEQDLKLKKSQLDLNEAELALEAVQNRPVGIGPS